MKKHSVKNEDTKRFASFAQFAAQTDELLNDWRKPVYAVFRNRYLLHTYPEPDDQSLRVAGFSQWPKDFVPPLRMEFLGTIADFSADSSRVYYGIVALLQSKILPQFLIKTFEVDRYRKIINKLISLSNCDKHMLQLSGIKNTNGVEIGRMAKVSPFDGNEQKPHHLVIQTQDDITTAAYSIPTGILGNNMYEYVLININLGLLSPHVLRRYAPELGFALYVYLTSAIHRYEKIKSARPTFQKRVFEKMLRIRDKYQLYDEFSRHNAKYIFLDHNSFVQKLQELQDELHQSSVLAPAVKNIELLI